MKKFQSDNYGNRVYNILNQNFVNGWLPMTRAEIEQRIGRATKDHQWGQAMKFARKKATENGLMIPKATAEGGFVYEITDDPNPVMPGLIHSMRQHSGIGHGIEQMRRFVEPRRDSLDMRLNGKVLEAAQILGEQQELMGRMLKLSEEAFVDVMNERKEIIAQDKISSSMEGAE